MKKRRRGVVRRTTVKKKSRGLPSGYDVAEHRFEEQEKNRRSYTRRFWLTAGNSARVIFLSDKPVIIEEHTIPTFNAKLGRKVYDPVTSPESFGERDPLKEAGSRPTTVAVYTVVNMNKWKDKKGVVRGGGSKELLVVKQQAFDVIKRRRSEIIAQAKRKGVKRTLMGAMFSVHRSKAQMEPRTGSDWQYLRHIPLTKVLKLLRKYAPDNTDKSTITVDQFDYEEVLAPPSLEEMKLLAKRFKSKARDDDEDENFESDDEDEESLFDEDDDEEEDDDDEEEEDDDEDEEDDDDDDEEEEEDDEEDVEEEDDD